MLRTSRGVGGRVMLCLVAVISWASLVSAFSFAPTGGMSFCKCTCFSNSSIIPLYVPKDILHPCLSCTRQFCLDQKLPACLNAKQADEDLDTGTGEEGDVEARCFERDSPKSHVVVVIFLVVTGALLLAAFLKEYAGIDVQAVYVRGGFRGVATEMVQLGQAAVQEVGRRRRGGAAAAGGYAHMPMPS